MINNITKKQKILKFLEKNGLSSTSKIAKGITSNYYDCYGYLKQLEKEKRVKSWVHPLGTMWEVTLK